MRRAIAAGAVLALAMAVAPVVSATQATGAPTQYASDAFGRTVTNGWGTADVGGAWSLTGSASAFSVSGGAGRMRMPSPSSSFNAYLGGVSSSDTQVQVGVGLDKAQTGGGTYVSVIGRRLSSNTDYRVKLHVTSGGAIVETLERVVSGTEVSLVSVTAPATYAPGAVVNVQLQVTGTSPSTLRSMIWLRGTTQPTTWQLTTTDSTSGMQSPGAVALLVYLSGSATNAPVTGLFSAFSATSTSSVNVLPVAAFTSSATNLVASFDASTSKDPDGTINSYAWTFGDSTTGTGVKPTHTYAAGGTYTVTLTVTDNSGGTNAVSHPITVAPAATGLPTYASIVNAAKLAANYYRTTYAHTTLTPKNGWSWSTYTQGVQTLFRQVGDQQYLNDNLAWGSSNSWAVETNEINPDTVKGLQTYYDLNALDSTAALTKADAEMASDLTNLPVSQYNWADALFMGLPDWTRWATRTGNTAYLTKMDSLYVWSRDEGATSSLCAGTTPSQPGLFSSTQGLWYRDCTFVGTKDANGQPIFWSRGNGWVIAAMAQVLQTLPASDLRRTKYASMLQTMAAAFVPLQGSDGFWRSSLVDPSLFPSPETSGTALITYALAYGIQAGLLSSAIYTPVVVKAWHGLSTMALQPSGFVTDCQANGVGPAAPYTATSPQTAQTSTSSGTVNTDEPPFCAGAFLLAGAQVAQLITSPSTGRPVTYTSQQVGNEASRVNDGNVTTRWSASGFPQSVTIDLGSAKSLSNAKVVPYLDRAYKYRVQTSTDNSHWTTVIDRTANTTGGSLIDNFTTGAISARYVRLTVTGVYNVSTTWVSIQEFAVYP
ncbi:MAG TPA: glycoside hydrolase family 88 protein [Acidothermaceae bacterium]|nr:glycoside hydrolase family 88 protein [Acidothermaceae bacterium]